MNYNEFIDEEFSRVDEILSNTQTAIQRILGKKISNQFHLVSEIRDIRNAMSNLEMSFRAERDKIREDEDKEKAELDAMRRLYYSNVSDEIEPFRQMIKNSGLAADLNHVRTFADAWHKCKQYYGIK
jgi:hypothetical protein